MAVSATILSLLLAESGGDLLAQMRGSVASVSCQDFDACIERLPTFADNSDLA